MHSNYTPRRVFFRDPHARTLFGFLVRSRRAMLWAIHDREANKAAKHARASAHWARLFTRRQERVSLKIGRSVYND
jgi:hypothetical protein